MSTDDGSQPTPAPRGEAGLPGRRVGPWVLGRKLGSGGNGTVFEGFRHGADFQQRVAIKFLSSAVDAELALRRFRYERQILATLTHVNIAALIDGGVSEDGDPWFAMEHVDGLPITEWCRERRLDIRGRLILFLQVCTAVQYAHRSLVIHRDLKPGNVMVDDTGTVKLLDFGIARLLRAGEGLELLPATIGATITATPEYAAPEQLLGQPIGTAADVYALGVILFELLAGVRPFDFRGRLRAEIEQTIIEEQPPRPSAVVTEEHATSMRSGSLARTRRILADDVDAVVLAALRKEPDRRYGSVDQFADDIRALLDGMPVTARPDGTGYRLRRLLRRRPMETAGLLLTAGILAGGIISAARQIRTANAAREMTVEVTGFLSDMLTAADPSQLGRDVTMRDVLDTAAVRARSLSGRPELEATIRNVLGRTYLGLGDYELGRDQLLAAVEARQRADSPDQREIAMALSQLALAWEYIGDFAVADSIAREGENLFRRVASPGDPALAEILDRRASMQQEIGDLATADSIQREALAVRLRFSPDDHAGLATAYNNLAVIVGQLGNTAVAESLHVEALTFARSAYGERHPQTAMVLAQHAHALEMDGQLERSDSSYRAALAMRREVLGPTHPDYAWNLFQYAQFLARRERWQEAADYSRQVLELRGSTLAESHPAVATALQALGIAMRGLGDSTAAGQYLRESLELRRSVLPEGNWLVSSGESVLGEHLAMVGRFGEAERLLLGAERQLVATRGNGSPQVRDTRQRLADLYDRWRRPAEAARWQKLLGEGAEGQ